MAEAVVVRTPEEVDRAMDNLLGKGELRDDLTWLVNMVRRFVAAGIDVEVDVCRYKVSLRISERFYVLLYGHGNPRRLLLEDAVYQFLVVAPATGECTSQQFSSVCDIFNDELNDMALSDEAYEAKASVTPKTLW